MKKETNKIEVNEQLDIQAICKKHNIGRYDLILMSAVVSRELDLKPHEAFKRMLESDNLKELESQCKTARLTKDLKGLWGTRMVFRILGLEFKQKV